MSKNYMGTTQGFVDGDGLNRHQRRSRRHSPEAAQIEEKRARYADTSGPSANQQQTQHHAGGRPQGMVFPSTPEGRVALEHYRKTGEVLPPPARAPADLAEVDDPGDLPLFDDDDVRQALKIYKANVAMDEVGSMREVLMFGLKLAAINLGVRPE